MSKRNQEINDVLQEFRNECDQHGNLGYAMSSGYLHSMVYSLLCRANPEILDTELRLMRDFIQRKAHERTLAALKS
jgi:hypothetical protein